MKKILKLIICFTLLLCGCNFDKANDNQSIITMGNTETEVTTEKNNINTTNDITTETTSIENIVENYNTITLEYVCNEFGISESEFEGIDFEHFIEYYGIAWDSLNGKDILYLLEIYKENDGKGKYYNYEYLYQFDKDVALTRENQDEVVTILFVKSQDNYHESWVFDFENNLKFYSDYGIELMLSNQITATLSIDDKNAVLDIIEKYDVYSWFERREELHSESWDIAVEFADGTIAFISGAYRDEEFDFLNLLLEVQKIGE